MNREQIRAYGETFTIDERAHAVSELREWFEFDTWTVREGLLLLVGINPYRSKDLLLTESGFESTPNPSWARITATPGLSASEVDANGWPRITGLIFNPDEFRWLYRVLHLWKSNLGHTRTGRHEPHYYLEWAGSKNCTPYWREWALDAKLFIDTAPVQAAATPAPVAQAIETKEQRQDRRLHACVMKGLVMPKSYLSRLPDGVGQVADCENVTRQTFSTDVKAALKRRESAIKDGRIIRSA